MTRPKPKTRKATPRAKARKATPNAKARKATAKVNKAPRGLHLEVESGKIYKTITNRQLRAAIDHEKFAILGGGPRSNRYIQTAEQDTAPFLYLLEYQDGSIRKHYRAVSDGVEFEKVLAAFRKYLRADPSWRDDFTWERMDI